MSPWLADKKPCCGRDETGAQLIGQWLRIIGLLRMDDESGIVDRRGWWLGSKWVEHCGPFRGRHVSNAQQGGKLPSPCSIASRNPLRHHQKGGLRHSAGDRKGHAALCLNNGPNVALFGYGGTPRHQFPFAAEIDGKAGAGGDSPPFIKGFFGREGGVEVVPVFNMAQATLRRRSAIDRRARPWL